MFFSDLDAFWAPRASHGAPGKLPEAFLHDFNEIRESFWQSVCKEDKANPTKRSNKMPEKQAAGETDNDSFHNEAGWNAFA